MAEQSTISRSGRLLLEDATFAEDPPAKLAGPRDIVLSRAFCRFRLFRAPPRLSGGKLARAALIFAEANAPYADTGMLVLRAPAGAAIWYWDKSTVNGLEPLREVSPESVWRSPGDGWRIVKCAEGFEAQYWEAGSLIASTWRREAFTEAQWVAFVLGVDQAAQEAGATPPAAIELPLEDARWRWRMVKPPLGWRELETAGVSVALCSAAVAALFAGQALHQSQIASAESAQTETLQAQLRDDPAIARTLENTRLLRDAAAARPSSDVLFAAVELHETLSRFGAEASAWRAGENGVSALVTNTDAPVREIVAALEAGEHLCGAVPEIAREGRFEVRANIERAGHACERRPRS